MMMGNDSAVNSITAIFAERLSTGACDELFDQMYPAIKMLARNELMKLNPGQQLSPTVLVNECYLKLKLNESFSFKNRQHFYNTVSRCMRFFLIDIVRQHHRLKRKGVDTELQVSQVVGDSDIALDLMELDDALQQLEQIDPELAQIVHLKFFSGMTFEDMAAILTCSTSQVFKQWQVARSLLVNLLEDSKVS